MTANGENSFCHFSAANGENRHSLRSFYITPRYTDMVNELATLGDDPNHLNEFGEAPLCVAAFKG